MINRKENFINKAKVIHNNSYDYSSVEYINNRNKVKIICKIHGIFEQRPDNHICLKQGCSMCSGNNKRTTDEFIKLAKLKHNNLYKYPNTNYINDSTYVDILCEKHGEFKQIPNAHLRGAGCGICSGNIKLTNEEFVNKSNEKHNNFYDYSKSNYTGINNKVLIICPKHGEFSQVPNSHLRGVGCPFCNHSKGEKLIKEYLKENKIEFIPQHRFDDCKSIRPLPFDFYLPDYNMCIEYNGEQHYKPIKFFGGVKKFNSLKYNDETKVDFCNKNNIELIIVTYKDSNIIDILNTKIKKVSI
jgi:hypothetical protein